MFIYVILLHKRTLNAGKAEKVVFMSIIYTPKGKAREYSPYAANLYSGCNHGCKYCYAPGIVRKKRDEYIDVVQRRNVIRDFEKDCEKMAGLQSQVLFCFMTDPYNVIETDKKITRWCLNIALKNKIPISILTKSKLVLRDIDLFKKFAGNINVGMTLTMDNEKDSCIWEPNAATPEERLKALKALKDNGIKTWASFEPVIDTQQSLNMIKRSVAFVDLYKIGKLNNYKGLDKIINWNQFLIDSVEIVRNNNKNLYVKHDLRTFANGFKLYGNETNQDEFTLSWN